VLISPELLLAFADYFNSYYAPSFVNVQASSFFDSCTNNLNYIFEWGILSFFMFLFFSWVFVYFFFTVNTLLTWSTYNYSQFVRFYMYFFWMSKDTRFQFEVVLQTAVFFFFYRSMTIITLISSELLLAFFDYFNSYHAPSFVSVRVSSCLGPMSVLESLLISLPTKNRIFVSTGSVLSLSGTSLSVMSFYVEVESLIGDPYQFMPSHRSSKPPTEWHTHVLLRPAQDILWGRVGPAARKLNGASYVKSVWWMLQTS